MLRIQNITHWFQSKCAFNMFYLCGIAAGHSWADGVVSLLRYEALLIVYRHRCFGGTCGLHLQVSSSGRELAIPWICSQRSCMIYLINCNWVNTRWQLYSTHNFLCLCAQIFKRHPPPSSVYLDVGGSRLAWNVNTSVICEQISLVFFFLPILILLGSGYHKPAWNLPVPNVQ